MPEPEKPFVNSEGFYYHKKMKKKLIKKLLLYGSMITAGILWQTDILEGSFTFYTFLRIVGFIAIFVVYEVWIQVLLPMWEEWEKNDK